MPVKYTVIQEQGVFDYTVFGQINGIPAGRWVIVERSGEMPENMTNAMIKVIASDKSHVDVWMTKNGKQWQFVMPECDVRIVPTVKRKFRD